VADRRFEGAITTPEPGAGPPDSSVPPAPVRPRRPLLVEFAAAILVVGGLTGLLGILGAPDRADTDVALDMVFIGLDILTVIVGLLVRAGRAWRLALNVVAIVLFLEATALPSGVAIVFVVFDTIVLFALIRYRDWFDAKAWTAAAPATTDDGAARPGDSAAPPE
jgi:hypothetical protein